MNYATMCSGIGAPEAAFSRLGWSCVFQSEIEPFPCAVLKHHYPGVPNYGDMLQWRFWPNHDLDLLVAGTPCQAFSLAGLRKSLDDDRGNLTLEFARYADHVRPRFILWENVPGVLSTKDNAFGCFLAAMAGCDAPLLPRGGRWTNAGFIAGSKRQIAWRILDAQFFGLAQRRRRVWLCAGDLERGAGNWACARALFPERESLHRNSAPCGTSGEEIARSLRGRANPSHRADADTYVVAASVSSKWAKGTGGPAGDECYNLVTATITKNYATHHGRTAGNNGGIATGQLIAHTLRGVGHNASEDGTGRGTPLVFEPRYARNGRGAPTDVVPPLKAHSGETGKGDAAPCVVVRSDVRRLTPTECERLQGFPDGYTDITYRGKPAPDGPRYKALGNSMAVPCLEWIGRNIEGGTHGDLPGGDV